MRKYQALKPADEDVLDDHAEVLDDDDIELTAEDVAGKFCRLLIRAAAAYLLSKRLTALLNSTVHFNEGGVGRTLHFSTAPRRHLWNGLDMDTFDRMRVLSTELNRLQASGQFVKITETPPKQSFEGVAVFS